MSEKNNIACPKCNYVQGHARPTVAYWGEKMYMSKGANAIMQFVGHSEKSEGVDYPVPSIELKKNPTKFGVIPSSGNQIARGLRRDGLLSSELVKNKAYYKITDKGRQYLAQ